jgi:hypothetical protein
MTFPFLCPCSNILESFRDLLQGITSVDDRLELPSCGKFRDEIHSFQVFDGHTALCFLTPADGGPKHPNHVGQTHDAGKKETFGLQRVLALVESGRADDVKYRVAGKSRRIKILFSEGEAKKGLPVFPLSAKRQPR